MTAFNQMRQILNQGFGWAARTGQAVGQELLLGRPGGPFVPSRNSRRTGILAPGDAPGVSGGYLDYRGVGLPGEYTNPSAPAVRVGDVCHPQGFKRRPAFIDWSTLNRHTAVIGPSGAGKTISVLAPWIIDALECGIGVVAVDTKGDLLKELKRVRGPGPLGLPVRRWDIAHTGSRVTAWNPLDEIVDDTTLQAVVTSLLGEVDTGAKDAHFQKRDHRWLRGLLRLTRAAIPESTLNSAYALLVDHKNLSAYAAAYPPFAFEIQDLLGISLMDYGLAISGLANALGWASQSVPAEATARSDFSVADCLASNGLTIIGCRVSAGEPAYAACAAFIGVLRTAIFAQFSRNNSPTLLVLDEVAQYADRIELGSLLELSRGAGVGVVLGLQNVDQLGTDDGEVANRLANCATMITLPGISKRSADYFASRLGEHTVKSVTIGVAHDGKATRSVGNERVPVLGSREIIHPPLGRYSGLLHSTVLNRKPFVIDLARPALSEG